MRILVVEDEFAVLLLVEDMLLELGFTIAGTASRIEEALGLARSLDFDAAVLDVNLNGQHISPVAEIVAERGLPIVFSTGYGRSGLEPHWRDRPIVQKPYRVEELNAALQEAIAAIVRS